MVGVDPALVCGGGTGADSAEEGSIYSDKGEGQGEGQREGKSIHTQLHSLRCPQPCSSQFCLPQLV